MKTIVYLNGEVEATAWADKHVAAGKARYATQAEIESYEMQFEEDDARSMCFRPSLGSGGLYERGDC